MAGLALPFCATGGFADPGAYNRPNQAPDTLSYLNIGNALALVKGNHLHVLHAL